jgi:hypothetical protein
MASRAALLLLLLAAACARSTLQSSVADTHGGTKPTQELDFWDGVAVAPAVSNRDAIHALLLSFGKQAQGSATDWTTEIKAAKQRAWIGDDEDLYPNETVRTGLVARVVCMEAKIKGGATMRVFGPAERYAVKELNYMGWLNDMTAAQTMSGGQLIAVLSKAEDHIVGKADPGPEGLLNPGGALGP